MRLAPGCVCCRPNRQNAAVPSDTGVTVLAALRLEALAIGGPVELTGMGHVKAGRTGARLARSLAPGRPLAIVGIAGGLEPSLEPGQLVVADTLEGPDGGPRMALPQGIAVAAAIRAHGRDVRVGAVACSTSIVHGSGRAELARGGALAVEMESVWLARVLGDHPLVVVRAVGDTERHGFVLGNLKALAALRHLRPALDQWARDVSGPDPVDP
jgi:4-hydroxy-3-methylbut-2-enyl diphosphate reductase